MPSIVCSNARAPVAKLVRASDQNSEILAGSQCLIYLITRQMKHLSTTGILQLDIEKISMVPYKTTIVAYACINTMITLRIS